MAAPIKKLEKVYCSLNLGYIYNISYDFNPQEGTKITVFFVNETGDYDVNFLSATVPVSIKIGKAQFQMYAIDYEYSMDGTRKVIGVNFVDRTFQLNNYYIVLGQRGCGQNVYSLGHPILDETQEAILTPREKAIRDLTTLFDLEYTFLEFISILGRVFPVQALVPIDNTVTRDFTGSFREVLDAWCSYMDYFCFFENGVIKIYNSIALSIIFPDVPTDALSFSRKESLANTYSKTASLYYEADGGEQAINSTVDNGGAAAKNSNGGTETSNADNILTTLTLFPYNSQLAFGGFESDRLTIEPNFQQCIAASYGQAFWFLYNYYNNIGKVEVELGLTDSPTKVKGSYYSEIGLTIVPQEKLVATVPSYTQTINALNAAGLSSINESVFNENYNKYFNYGRNVAGRIYLTYEQYNIDYYDQFTFVVSNQIFEIGDGGQLIDKSNYKLTPFTVPDGGSGILPNTSQQGFDGLSAVGNRMTYYDSYVADYNSIFALPSGAAQTLQNEFILVAAGIPASSNFQNTFLGGGNWVVYQEPSFITNTSQILINDTVNTFLATPPALVPRYPDNIAFQGYLKISNLNFNSTEATTAGKPKTTAQIAATSPAALIGKTKNSSQNNPQQNSADSATVTSADQIRTTTVLGGVNNNQAVQPYAFYSKFQKCSSQTQGFGNNVFGHRFQAKQISIDTPLRVVVNQQGNSYTITRDTAYIDDLRWQGILSLISTPHTITEKSLSFSLNYFYEIPENFLSNGLTSLSLEVGPDGLSANYTFSNAMMFIQEFQSQEAKIEQAIKTSYIRQYSTWSRFNSK